jgi:glycosyltransferase involved in cell wall biosynthesis
VRVAAFTKYDREAASTRQRVLQYLPHLDRAGIMVEVHPLLDDAYVRSLASGDRPSRRAVAAAYARRLGHLLRGDGADLLWVYAELFPWLPAGFERLAFRSGKPLLYDFDDAFFHAYDDHPNRIVRALLGGKLVPLIEGAAAVCAGNPYLRDHAARHNPATHVLPTVVDTDEYRPAHPSGGRPLTIGWIGSPSTWHYVKPVLPLLADLAREGRARFLAVGAGAGAAADRFAGMTLEPWSEATEIAAVQAMDIGIMPLPDEPWARGKCGYKLIQYMACGLPVVASPVGVNAQIVTDATGLLASGLEPWRAALGRLVGDAALRRRMGEAGRARAVEAYSLHAHAPRLIEIMRRAAATPARP